jgi:hypothetical protein
MKEEVLSLRQKYQTILTKLAPAGAIGVSLALGAAAPAVASTPAQNPTAATAGVSDRLAAVRAAVSAIDQKGADTGQRVAWWGNGFGGFGWPNWHNWNNWGNWFHNW